MRTVGAVVACLQTCIAVGQFTVPFLASSDTLAILS